MRRFGNVAPRGQVVQLRRDIEVLRRRRLAHALPSSLALIDSSAGFYGPPEAPRSPATKARPAESAEKAPFRKSLQQVFIE
ncbi:hypothetical protein NTCA1_24890 [Novosphingobium sp. TCA1]|nr:hypothetical protein NTCA1_24890 [Novosphingobium sp. TCA1]